MLYKDGIDTTYNKGPKWSSKLLANQRPFRISLLKRYFKHQSGGPLSYVGIYDRWYLKPQLELSRLENRLRWILARTTQTRTTSSLFPHCLTHGTYTNTMRFTVKGRASFLTSEARCGPSRLIEVIVDLVFSGG